MASTRGNIAEKATQIQDLSARLQGLTALHDSASSFSYTTTPLPSSASLYERENILQDRVVTIIDGFDDLKNAIAGMEQSVAMLREDFWKKTVRAYNDVATRFNAAASDVETLQPLVGPRTGEVYPDFPSNKSSIALMEYRQLVALLYVMEGTYPPYSQAPRRMRERLLNIIQSHRFNAFHDFCHFGACAEGGYLLRPARQQATH